MLKTLIQLSLEVELESTIRDELVLTGEFNNWLIEENQIQVKIFFDIY